ncbi:MULTISPECIES: TetR/AcrR family transcriptional regulator [unclassified Aeromicrobium]|jgi:AcrR family transcriptional regulator|uniref:TetR/AcrR family transcriptional regulator n=1 Tax=unclassified Aeromicrobium TaxID=2633570 RepID=UPI000A6B0E29|nr:MULTISPECIES: TetR/AcrR family transcriptional regulator [unclassified Aeromicrobium]
MDDLDRRTTIIEAAERLLSRGGVEAVSMRNVAVEAGVSLRLVQYYGKSKNELLTAVLQAMSERSVQHWQQALDSASGTQDAPLRAFFDAALPHDEQSRAFHRLGVSLEQLSASDPDGMGAIYRGHLERLASSLASHIDEPDPAAIAHAYEVMALSHGLGSLISTNAITVQQARAIASDYMDRYLAT